MDILLPIYRMVVILLYTFTMWYDINVIGFKAVPKLEKMQLFMGGRFVFLTVWNMILIVLYNSIALINDIFGTNDIVPSDKKNPLIRKVRDYVFSALSFPLSMFVGVTFWSIYFYDREMIYPRMLDAFVPSWVNHTMHTLIVFLTFVEMFSTYKKYSSKKAAFIGITVGVSAYMMIIVVARIISGIWIYPILRTFGPVQLILFIAGVTIYGVSFYFVGEFLNDWYWANRIKQTKRKIK